MSTKRTLIYATLATMMLGSCSVMGNNNKQAQKAVAAVESREGTPRAATTVADDLAGTWTIYAIDSLTIEPNDNMPYITFEPQEGKFYASNGCNILNGSYSIRGNRMVPIEVLSTMRYCPDDKYSSLINTIISDDNPLKVQILESGQDFTGILTTPLGRQLWMKRNASAGLNGQWVVAKIGNDAINDDEVNIFIDTTEGKVHGNTGCNFFNGTVNLTPNADHANAISFGGMGVTRMACPNSERETAYLVALEQTTSYRLQGGQLKLLDAAGKTLLTLNKQ